MLSGTTYFPLATAQGEEYRNQWAHSKALASVFSGLWINVLCSYLSAGGMGLLVYFFIFVRQALSLAQASLELELNM